MNMSLKKLVWACGLMLILPLSSMGREALPSKAAPSRGKKQVKVQPQIKLQVPSAEAVKKTKPTPDVRIGDRDPFRALTVAASAEPEAPSLPGKRGLHIRTLRVKGIVSSENQWIAMVDTPQSPAALFLRRGDEVADGQVVAIRKDAVVFEERAVDPLGKPYTREVVKKISGSGGAIQ